MTIFGKHVITEARDLMATVEFRIKQTNKLIAEGDTPDGPQQLGTIANWRKWEANWRKVADSVATNLTIQSVASPLVPADALANEPEYQRLKCAINKSCNDTHGDPGDMFNVVAAVEVMRDKRIDETIVPQPQAGDMDIAALQKLDAAIKKGEAAAAAVKEGAKSAAFQVPWWAWALGAVGVAGVGFVVYETQIKPFLPSTYAPKPHHLPEET